MNQIGGIVGLQFPKVGDYQFALLVDNQEERTIGLQVNPIQEEG